MYKTIVVPLDGSALAEQSLEHAAALATAFKARVHLVRVYDVSAALAPGMMPIAAPAAASAEIMEEAARAEEEKSEGYIVETARRFDGRGFEVEYSVQRGPTVEMLAALVEQLPADLVVITTRGEGGLKRFVFGSVTDELIRRVEVPLLVIPSADD